MSTDGPGAFTIPKGYEPFLGMWIKRGWSLLDTPRSFYDHIIFPNPKEFKELVRYEEQ